MVKLGFGPTGPGITAPSATNRPRWPNLAPRVDHAFARAGPHRAAADRVDRRRPAPAREPETTAQLARHLLPGLARRPEVGRDSPAGLQSSSSASPWRRNRPPGTSSPMCSSGSIAEDERVLPISRARSGPRRVSRRRRSRRWPSRGAPRRHASPRGRRAPGPCHSHSLVAGPPRVLQPQACPLRRDALSCDDGADARVQPASRALPAGGRSRRGSLGPR